MGGIGFKNSSYYWLKGTSKYSAVARGRWTPETAATATYPRLTTKDNSNNLRNSTFWLKSTDRFDLGRVQLTYDLPDNWFTGKVVSGMSIYALAEGLFTISTDKEWRETAVGGAPYNRFYNLGVKLSF